MATHNVDDGTGGLDGSIVYELDRAEVRLSTNFPIHANGVLEQNAGAGFVQTVSDFEIFPNKYVSRASRFLLTLLSLTHPQAQISLPSEPSSPSPPAEAPSSPSEAVAPTFGMQELIRVHQNLNTISLPSSRVSGSKVSTRRK